MTAQCFGPNDLIEDRLEDDTDLHEMDEPEWTDDKESFYE